MFRLAVLAQHDKMVAGVTLNAGLKGKPKQKNLVNPKYNYLKEITKIEF